MSIRAHKKVKLSVYLRDYFDEGSAPSRATVISWIERDLIAGEQMGDKGKNGKRGGPWYVYPDAKPIKNQALVDLIAEFDQEAVNYAHGTTTQ